MSTPDTDRSLAHAVARIGLGINIAMHGLVRWPILDTFASGMQEQFAGSILQPALVRASAYGIVAVETVAGLLLLFGLWLRPALLAGSGLMFVLLFGSCLIQNWSAAGTQMIYLAFFVTLIATARHDAFSIDAWRKNKNLNPPVP